MRNIAIQLTKGCNLRCAHCGTDSSPSVDCSFSIKDLELLFCKIEALNGKYRVGFTGGEPFYEEELFIKGVHLARKHKIGYGVTSNGSWAVDTEKRKRVLEFLDDSESLGLSCDKYHQKYIPAPVVGQVLKDAVDLGLKAAIRYTLDTTETEEDALKVLELSGTEYSKNVEFGELQYVGRAINLPSKNFPVHPNGPCGAASVPIICSTGDVYACCGESINLSKECSLYLGNIFVKSLEYILHCHSTNMVIQAMRTYGPMNILGQIKIKDDKESNEILSRSPCGCCRLLLSTKSGQDKLNVWAKERMQHINIIKAYYYGETDW
ncbi:radical SAM protein [Desulfosarcina sp.]|nr:radical SAM protein [Desulfosarcina sp.]